MSTASSPHERSEHCLTPMLAKLSDESVLTREGFLFEPKLDGIRTIFRKHRGRIELYNRHCVSITHRYPELQLPEAIRDDECMLDGEIVWYNSEGNPDFPELMKRHQRTPSPRLGRLSPHTLRFAVFDMISRNGKDLRNLPLLERKQVLLDSVTAGGYLEQTLHTPDGPRLWEAIQKRSLEGVIAKRADSLYESGRRTGAWLKIKSFKTVDCVIVGYSSEKRPVSALAAALYDDEGRLQFIGKVGTGFSESEVRRLLGMLSAIQVAESPAEGVPPNYRGIQWVEPRYVCELRYLEIGSQGMMRNPSYLRLRPDKVPEDCTISEQLPASSR